MIKYANGKSIMDSVLSETEMIDVENCACVDRDNYEDIQNRGIGSEIFATAEAHSPRNFQRRHLPRTQLQLHRMQYSLQHQIGDGVKKNPSADHLEQNNDHLIFKSQLTGVITEADSRALILFHHPSLSPSLIQTMCQSYGLLYYLRSEFHNRGTAFIGYFDLRNAVHAKSSLSKDFLQLDPYSEIHFSYLLPFNMTTCDCTYYDESRLIVRKVSADVAEDQIHKTFSRYGGIHSIQRLFVSRKIEDDDLHTNGSVFMPVDHADVRACDRMSTPPVFVVSYHNILDARHAFKQLTSSSGAIISVAPVEDYKSGFCKQLLAT